MGPVSMTEGPCMSFLIPLSKSLEVGLKCRGLLFQGEETLLHLVKLGREEFLVLDGLLNL